MKGFLPGLVHWATVRDFCPALTALVGPVQIIIFLPFTVLLHLSHHPASWAGSRAASPVSYYVSLVHTLCSGAPPLQKMAILLFEMWSRQNISLLSHQVFPVIDKKGTGHRI